MAEGCEIEHITRWHGGQAAQFPSPIVKKRDTTGSIVDRVDAGFRPARGCIKLLDFSLSSIGWRRAGERRCVFIPLSSVLSPLVPHGERMESMMQPCARPVRPRCRLTGALVARPRTARSCFRRQIKPVASALPWLPFHRCWRIISPASTRFNGAPLRRARNCQCARVRPGRLDASTGPRSVERGIEASSSTN